MANDRRIVTVEYLESEGLNHKQDYFADVSADEASGNRELSLKDANNNVVGQIIAQKEGGVLFKDVATPAEATDGANKGYADNNFANALKGTASGASVRLDDASPIEHTLGVKVRGKNLIPYPYYDTTKTLNGITFTVNSDGSVIVNGTATANSVFELESDATMFALPVGNYFLSGCPSGGSLTSYFMAAVNGVGISYDKFLRDFGNGISVPSKGEKWKISIRIMSGYTADNLVFKPQLELGSTATSYTLYISDFSTVNVTRCGKNLIPYPYSDTTKTQNGITFTVNADGSISFSGTSTSQATFYFIYKALNLKQGVTYTLSVSGNYSFGGSATIYIYDSTQGQSAYIPLLTASSATFTPTKDVNNTRCYLVIPGNRTVSGTLKIQLELGSTATEYELYKTPTEFTPATDGTVTGVKSLYPTTALITNTSGVIIDAEYNRDINKAFAEMQQAILSMGGNV